MAKEKTISKDLTKNANSKAPIVTFTTADWAPTLLPDYSFDKLLKYIDADPVASGAVNHFVDKFIEGDWAVIKRDSGKYDKQFEDELFYSHSFEDSILKRIALLGKLFNNVFIEIVRSEDGRSVKNLNILDTTQLEVITRANGDLIRLKSIIPNPDTGEYAIWDREDVVWLKFGNRDGGYAHVDGRALWGTLLAKGFVQRFVSWLWQTGQYRVVHNFKASDSKTLKDFVAMNKKTEHDYTKPFLSGGEYQHTVLRDMKETESLVELLKYYDSQILILLRVPPIDAGIPDASGRSNADAQSNNLATTIKSFKKTVTAGVNELFKKMNKGNNAIVFAPIDKQEVKLHLENVQLMKSAGFTDDVCVEYLRDNGMVWQTDKVFVEPEEQTMENPRDLDNMPSRQGKGVGQGNESIGSGEQSTTRRDQLTKNSRPVQEYYEPSDQWREY